ncbi:hypothetical protein ZWY2020_030279, partial [Hordeum vulgare]
PPLDARCAVCRGVDISLPHQANCSHWFCEFPTVVIVICLCTRHCIVGVWLHASVLRPACCPFCCRSIWLGVLYQVVSLVRDEPEISPVMNRIRRYNEWLIRQPYLKFLILPCNLDIISRPAKFLRRPSDIVPSLPSVSPADDKELCQYHTLIIHGKFLSVSAKNILFDP